MRLVGIWFTAFVVLFSSTIFETKAEEHILIKKTDKWTLSKSKDGIAVFKGRLDEESVPVIIKYFEGLGVKNKSLNISSIGGPANPAVSLGRFIRDNNISVHVTGLCGSSCAYFILPASTNASFGKNAVIGFHNAPSAKYFEARERTMNNEKVEKFLSISKEKRLEMLEFIKREKKKTLPVVDKYYTDLELDKDTLLRITNLYIAADNILKKRKLPNSVRKKVLIMPDQIFLKNCLGYNLPAWTNFTEDQLLYITKREEEPMVAVYKDKLIFNGEVISEAEYKSCSPARI